MRLFTRFVKVVLLCVFRVVVEGDVKFFGMALEAEEEDVVDRGPVNVLVWSPVRVRYEFIFCLCVLLADD